MFDDIKSYAIQTCLYFILVCLAAGILSGCTAEMRNPIVINDKNSV